MPLPSIVRKVHVNVPFCMLNESYLDFVLENRINPEIGLDARALDGVEDSVFGKCAGALAENGASVSFHGPFVDLSPGSIDPEIRKVSRKRFEQVLRLVPIFRPKTVVCHTGYEELRHGYMLDQWLENSLAAWRWFADELNALGTRLVIENVFEPGPENLLPLLESLKGRDVGFCLDVGHQSAFSRSSLRKWLDVLGSYLRQLHLHDNRGDSDSHLAMGKGGIEFHILFEFLRQHSGIQPLITLEPHVDDDLGPSLFYLEEHWPWGRNCK